MILLLSFRNEQEMNCRHNTKANGHTSAIFLCQLRLNSIARLHLVFRRDIVKFKKILRISPNMSLTNVESIDLNTLEILR